MRMSLRVTWISGTCPLPAHDGNRQRQLALASGLARHNAVTLICPRPDGDGIVEQLEARGLVVSSTEPPGQARGRVAGTVRGRPSAFVPAGIAQLEQRARQTQTADVAMGGLDVAAAVLAAPARFRVIDDQNVEARRYRRLARSEPVGPRKLARWLDAAELTVYERRWLGRADGVTVCSDVDAADLAAIAGSDVLTRTLVVPNGADVERLAALRPSGAGDGSIVFVGSMSYEPNVQAVTELVGTIMPLIWDQRPDTTLHVVGKHPPPAVAALAGERVVVTGEVEDVRPYLSNAALTLVPLRVGGGTRLKLLEAMAAGVPVVATPLAAEGLAVRDGVHGMFRERPRDLAAAALELLAAPEVRSRLAAAARELVATRYAWPAVVGTLEAWLSERVAAATGRA